MRYPIAIEPGNAGHAYGVVVPDIPGCFSAGDTLDEALANAPEAIALWMSELIERGDMPPNTKSQRPERSTPTRLHTVASELNSRAAIPI